MKTSSSTLFRAFRHPLVIGSILLLLVNDHLLKITSPSWLTGKLSDFAGLFFFPFLLALVLRAAIREDDRALRCALLLTGLAFTAIKTLPAANAAAVWAASRVLGPTVRFALDPSDLLALVMLPAGWLFWKQLRAQAAAAAPGRLGYAVMALGSLAALATSPCPPATSVQRLAVLVGKVYAGVGHSWSISDPSVYVLSEDGQTWNWVPKPTDAVRSALLSPDRVLPISQCDPADPRLCYQIDGQAIIWESRNGGQTWQVSWQYPPGRETYMEHAGIPGSCGDKPEQHLYDLAILPSPGGPVIIAAAGNQGVVMRRGSEPWQRMGLESGPKPSPTQSSTFDQAFGIISLEFLFAGVASLLAYTMLSVMGRRYTATDARHPDWALHPALFVLPWLLAGLAVWMAWPPSMLAQTVPVAAANALPFMLLVLLLTTLSGRGVHRTSGLLALLAVFAVLAIPVIFFLLWAFGVITHYVTALILVLGVTLPVFAWLYARIQHRLAEAGEPPADA